ncbi:hypothetical protein ACX8XP_03980 [Calditrichota bacterium LG25]
MVITEKNVLFDKAYKKYGHLFKDYGPYVVKGRVQSRLLPINRDLHCAPTGVVHLLVDEVEFLPLEKGKLETDTKILSLLDGGD